MQQDQIFLVHSLYFLIMKRPTHNFSICQVDLTLGHTILMLGLNQTGFLSFLTGQDWTPKFAGQVLPDRTESGLLSNILPAKKKFPGDKFGAKNAPRQNR